MPETALQIPSEPSPGGKRRNWKIDTQKVQELYESGLTYTDIAKHQGVAVSTIKRYIDKISGDLDEFNIFKNNSGDMFKALSHKAVKFQNTILDSLNGCELEQKEKISNADLLTGTKVLKNLTYMAGVAFDKGRLADGETTQNIGVGLEVRLSKALEKSREAADNSSPGSDK